MGVCVVLLTFKGVLGTTPYSALTSAADDTHVVGLMACRLLPPGILKDDQRAVMGLVQPDDG